MLPCEMPKRHVWAHFVFRTLSKSKIGALLVPFSGNLKRCILRGSQHLSTAQATAKITHMGDAPSTGCFLQ
jgi:hypothetical protein